MRAGAVEGRIANAFFMQMNAMRPLRQAVRRQPKRHAGWVLADFDAADLLAAGVDQARDPDRLGRGLVRHGHVVCGGQVVGGGRLRGLLAGNRQGNCRHCGNQHA